MRLFKGVLAAAAIMFGGCATGEWQASDVPLPTATPFDSNQMARGAYLDGFRQGYHAQRDGSAASVELLGGPYLQPRQQGFHAGAAQARSGMTGEPVGK
jgi:hypothetical protein